MADSLGGVSARRSSDAEAARRREPPPRREKEEIQAKDSEQPRESQEAPQETRRTLDTEA